MFSTRVGTGGSLPLLRAINSFQQAGDTVRLWPSTADTTHLGAIQLRMTLGQTSSTLSLA